MVTVKDSSRRKKEEGRRDLGLTLLEKFDGGSQRPTTTYLITPSNCQNLVDFGVLYPLWVRINQEKYRLIKVLN
ncbi:MAG: hypothetical protein F6K48_18215 [Okeania sp. SIO3H1]|uniref:hypothetical protein n=1 Tax=Okeania sp. SIO1I7 TaxID=2607772 RepID=UPI0013C6F303|nr:hypothetical protein [Okeania sp. SIO1I7]NEN90740.1 hypothetical protein [Okeania sp. SIO3H1]NET25954.1 hypothetical protein [Okeania sp. SIO1I7]